MNNDSFAQLADRALRAFSSCDRKSLNWRAAKDTWSIGECLDHIRKTNNAYRPGLEALLQSDHAPAFWEKHSPFTDAIGNNMVVQLGPVVTRKYKAPRLFLPSKSPLSADTVRETAEHLILFDGLFHELEAKGALDKVVRSPVSPLITLRTGVLLRSLIGHSARHLAQAEKITSDERFKKEQASLAERLF